MGHPTYSIKTESRQVNMKTKHIILVSLLVVVALVLVTLGPKAWLFTAGLREPVTVPPPDYWPTDGWQNRSPEELGFDSAALAEGVMELHDNQAAIDSLLVIHNGYVVLDAHFEPYDGTFPHDLASVTKSVTTTLIGIAVDQGVIDLDHLWCRSSPTGRLPTSMSARNA
jgi:hypothetical protein